VVDVNGDGIPDINVDCGGTVELFLGERNGMFEAAMFVGTYGANDIVAETLHGQAAGLADWVRDTNGTAGPVSFLRPNT
jgi:hypothetical protein